jgi:hypothetical protein
MKKVLVSAALAMALCPLAASAGDLSHTWVEAGASRLSFDMPSAMGYDFDFDGGYIRGSFAINENVYGFGGYARGTNDTYGFDLDLSEMQAGIGYAHGLNERTELVTELGYFGSDMNGSEYNGARLSAGLRGQLGSRVEAWAKASYTDGNFQDGNVAAQVGGMLKLTPNWGITGEVDANQDANRYMLGVRASF